MAADELVFKKKGRKFSCKIVRGMGNNHTPDNCHIKVNTENYKDVALFFHDLESLWNVPVGKAIEEYKRLGNDKLWPF